MSLEERLELLRATGVDFVATITFTSSLAQLSGREFLSTLENVLQVKHVIVGPGFALGRGRETDSRQLAELGLELGFVFEVVPPLVEDGAVISSSAIRDALATGDVRRAAHLLGRRFSLTGPVVHGDRRGGSIGFPTANIGIGADRCLPGDGVYATRAFVGEAMFPSATNIGLRPTFGVNGRTVETHLIDFEGDLYGREIRIEFVERLRGEERFAGVEALKAQIAQDVQRAREILA